MSRPDFAGMRLGFARARLGQLIGCPIVAIENVHGVNGPAPALIVEAPSGALVAVLALSDEEGNDDGSLEPLPYNERRI